MERFTLLVASDRYAGPGNHVRVRLCNTRNTLTQRPARSRFSVAMGTQDRRVEFADRTLYKHFSPKEIVPPLPAKIVFGEETLNGRTIRPQRASLHTKYV
jgi:hypothetical protein